MTESGSHMITLHIFWTIESMEGNKDQHLKCFHFFGLYIFIEKHGCQGRSLFALYMIVNTLKSFRPKGLARFENNVAHMFLGC